MVFHIVNHSKIFATQHLNRGWLRLTVQRVEASARVGHGHNAWPQKTGKKLHILWGCQRNSHKDVIHVIPHGHQVQMERGCTALHSKTMQYLVPASTSHQSVSHDLTPFSTCGDLLLSSLVWTWLRLLSTPGWCSSALQCSPQFKRWLWAKAGDGGCGMFKESNQHSADELFVWFDLIGAVDRDVNK